MSDTDFESNKRSLIVKRQEKVKNLDQETGRHWNQIHSEYYDFDYGRLFSTPLFPHRDKAYHAKQMCSTARRRGDQVDH